MTTHERKMLLNSQLKAILSKTQVSWNNLKVINELKKAILSKSEYYKKSVINKKI